MKLTKGLRHSKQKLAVKMKSDKKVSVSISKQDYRKLLYDLDKWPLTMRIAAELFRAGVTLERFENEMHLPDYGVSKQVYEALCKFHMGKGFDPLKVAPVLPTYLRYVSPSSVKKPKKGRPSTEDAYKGLCAFIEDRLSMGWTKGDILTALNSWYDNNQPKVVAVKIEEEDITPVITKTRTKTVYSIRVRDKWLSANSKKSAEALMKEEEASDKIRPVESPSTHCYCCALPLNGTTVCVRREKEAQLNAHIGCYYMELVPSTSLISGMVVMNPKTGKLNQWTPGVPDKGIAGEWREI